MPHLIPPGAERLLVLNDLPSARSEIWTNIYTGQYWNVTHWTLPSGKTFNNTTPMSFATACLTIAAVEDAKKDREVNE